MSIFLAGCGNFKTGLKTSKPRQIDFGRKGEEASLWRNYNWVCANSDKYIAVEK